MNITREQISLLINLDRKAQYELYKECFGYMMSISLRYQKDHQAAEDVVNRAYLKLLKYILTFDMSKPFKPWMARITVNENIDACRKSQKLRSIINYDSEVVNADRNLNHFEYNEAEENLEADQLRKMIIQLPDTTKYVFNLYVVEGFKHQEIADKLGLTVGTSKWHLNSARKRLKVMILKMKETEKIIHYGE
ncbi:MAG: RNA polymerase sigma factor (sigma-70 family) [Saprospiraceae bacterium]